MDSKRISFFVWGEKAIKQKGSFVFFLCKTTFFSLPNSLWSDFLGFTPEKLLSILVIFIATLRGCAYYNTRNSLCSGLLQGERSKGHEQAVVSNGDSIVSSLISKRDYYDEMVRFDGLSNFEITYFSKGNTKSTSDSLGVVVTVESEAYFTEHLGKTYSEKNPVDRREFSYHLYLIEGDDIYVRYGEEIPFGVLLARNFLIVGSIIVVLVDGLYLFFTFRHLEKSMNSLKIQVKKLQGVCGLSSNVVYHGFKP